MAALLGLLGRLDDAEERRTVWRRCIVSLAQDDGGPSPLEGMPEDELLAGVRVALATGLVDDLEFLDSPRAGAALYALASALPSSSEQRELGRRVLARLSNGDAHAFTAIATSMARAGAKAFQTPALKARMGLVMEMPLSVGLRDGPLALALASRRQLAREWVVSPSTGSLPARRLAARVIERAACEAARQASRGDPHALRALSSEAIRGAMDRLLADRETLVWRHVAIARGAVAPFSESGLDELDALVSPDLTPTEWRRAATAIGALVGTDPDRGTERARALLTSPVFQRDPGIGAALVWGTTRAIELEPEAAYGVISEVTRRAPVESAEAMCDLVLEWAGSDAVRDMARGHAAALAKTNDDEAHALEAHLRADVAMRPGASTQSALRHWVASALTAFANEGFAAAMTRTKPALEAARAALSNLEGNPREALGTLRDLDVALLQTTTLAELARLESIEAKGKTSPNEELLEQLRERFGAWLLEVSEEASVAVQLRALRALVHLVDNDIGEDARKRGARIAPKLLLRFEGSTAAALRRATSAALARAIDAMVRSDAIDPVDGVLACGRNCADIQRFEILAEASMDPSVRHAMSRYAHYLRAAKGTLAAGALDAWASDLVPDPSTRAETLRRVVHRLANAVAAIQGAQCLRDFAPDGTTDAEAVRAFELGVEQLSRMTRGARGRMGLPEVVREEGDVQPLAVELARVLSGAQPTIASESATALRARISQLPLGIAEPCLATVDRIEALPLERSQPAPSRSMTRQIDELPSWLPARRTIGGFYVHRRLGSGGGGSVFVAQRIEDRGDPEAEMFALKVPDYSAAVSQTLSEAEFLEMFRSEASALIALPHHPNLARFVTFDSGSRPKPILVMELVEGMTFEHVIASRAIDMPRTLQILDDVLAGLEAMHAVGIGHLDVKPSNILLRARGGKPGQAVLVDFGLAGRHVRPGCASGGYGAPEVWVPPQDGKSSPMKADVYAFGCVAFEALTGKVLFAANDEVQQIAVHLAHDGFPEPVRQMAQRPELVSFAELLFSMLRRDPKHRPDIGEVRSSLQRMNKDLSRLRWPIMR